MQLSAPVVLALFEMPTTGISQPEARADYGPSIPFRGYVICIHAWNEAPSLPRLALAATLGLQKAEVMRKTIHILLALCTTLLWVQAAYAQSRPGSAATQYNQAGAGCAPFFLPQKFPATGQTTIYVAGDDGAIRAGAPLNYTDNGDGTVTDKNTGLMWEKKDQSGGLHDWNNTYAWAGTCSNNSNISCGTDVDCANGGTCNVSGGGTTIFQWVAQLNSSPCFAHHCDWRIPNVRELQSIVDYETYLPPVTAAFNNNCTSGCTLDGADNTVECSCTQSAGSSKAYYWSSSTYAPSPIVQPPGSILAWGVLFGDGDVLSAGKSDHDYIRAVRCGYVRPDIH